MAPIVYLIIFVFIGVAIGMFTGLTPGVHVNTVLGVFFASYSVVFGLACSICTPIYAPVMIAALIISMSIAHTFLDIIPSVYLGAPEEDTALSVLPAHKMMMAGRGYDAIYHSALGSFMAIILSAVLLLPARAVLGEPVSLYKQISPYLGYLILTIAVIMIIDEKGELAKAKSHVYYEDEEKGDKVVTGRVTAIYGRALFIEGMNTPVLLAEEHSLSPGDYVVLNCTLKPILTIGDKLKQVGIAAAIFASSGAIGVLLLLHGLGSNLRGIVSLGNNAVLFPIFTGMFGISGLLLSLATNAKIPPQHHSVAKLRWPKALKGSFIGTLCGGLVGWLPGVSSGVATAMAGNALRDSDAEESDASGRLYILGLSSVNTANAFFALVALFVILRGRTGAAVAVMEVINIGKGWTDLWKPPELFLILVLAAMIAGFISYPLTILAGRTLSAIYSKTDYRRISLIVLCFVLVLLLLFTGLLGLMIAALCAALGVLPPRLGVRRVHLMGVLMLPLMLYFFGMG